MREREGVDAVLFLYGQVRENKDFRLMSLGHLQSKCQEEDWMLSYRKYQVCAPLIL